MFNNERLLTLTIGLVCVVLALFFFPQIYENFENQIGKTIRVKTGEGLTDYYSSEIVGYTRAPKCVRQINNLPRCVENISNYQSLNLCNEEDETGQRTDCYKIVDANGRIYYGNGDYEII